MRIHFCGVRGSTPAPGGDFARFGGHTSCVAIEGEDGSIRLVLDAGTGLRNLPRLLGGGAFRGSLLLGHLHWDHTHGLPFCRSLDHPDAQVHVLAPSQDGRPVDELLSQAMSPPNFPVTPGGLRGSWTWSRLEEGRDEVEGFEVLAREIPHKGGLTFGFRVSDGKRAVAYLSDHMPQRFGPGPDGWGEYHAAACELAQGADVLIHDAQYVAEELPTRGAFGHAAAEYAVALGRQSGVAVVALFHHDPERTDDEVDAIVNRFPGTGSVVAAAEGMVIEL